MIRKKVCGCAPVVVTKYQKRISAPILDRIDIHIEVSRVEYEKLSGDRICESSESIRTRVQAAGNIQLQRFSQIESSDSVCNANMHIGSYDNFANCQRKVRA
jgi:predicted ATPase with chaperone activity